MLCTNGQPIAVAGASMERETYNVVSLFSGGMGLDLGLEQTCRFRVLACVEKQPTFCETIRANQRAGRLHSGLKIFDSAIEEVNPHELLEKVGLVPGEVDLLAGGPPCQSFSTTGKRGTVQDPRGTLPWQFLRFVDILRPRFFIMENVRGLLSAALRHRPIAERPDKGGSPLAADEEAGSVVRAFADDLQKLAGDGYHMDCFEVNAVNYGAPQLRERAFFIGNRYNAVVDFPDPTHGPPCEGAAAQQVFDGFDDRPLPWRTLRYAIGDLDEDSPDLLDFSPRKKGFLAMVPPGSNWRSLPVDIQKESMGSAWHAKGGRSGWWRRLSYDLPCPTLLTMPNHAGTSLCHPTETRALTLREYARIQEFPDDWEFAGTTAEKYAQVGNAVPVRLGRVAGQVILDHLDRLRARSWEPYPDKPGAYRIRYVQSHVRTRVWYKDGATVVWADGGENAHASYKAPKTKRKETNMVKGDGR
jgi:DNA (cytosine-5)-methyltransferase 1